MKISYQWLRDYVDCQLAPRELAERLTRAGLETESIEPAGADHVLTVETTSNRPDHLGHLGVAREVAWICDTPLRMPTVETLSPTHLGDRSLAEWCALRVEDRAGCPRYTAHGLFEVVVEESPPWLRERLQAIGLRCINNVVDFTNYVLFEFGQPLHAFDLDRIAGATIVVRRATMSESITAINGRRYELGPDDLVIADARGPVAIAGIMGGADTEVTSATRRVLLESAFFDPVSVRRTAQRLQLGSDASYRFERRVDPAGVELAARRFCHLLVATGRARLLPGCHDALDPGLLRQPRVRLRRARVERVLGVELPMERLREMFVALGFEPTSVQPDTIEVQVPSFRGDVAREIDLIEEVARVHGLDNIPEGILSAFPAPETESERLLEGVKTALVGAGFREALTFSFVEAGEHQRLEQWWSPALPYEVRNPMRAPERFLRRSLLPNLLDCVRRNRHAGIDRVRLFEVARVFHRKRGAARPRESLHLAWADTAAEADLRSLRGLADAVLDHLRVARLDWVPLGQEVGCDPGAEAAVSGERAGMIGAARVAGVPDLVWVGEIDLGRWLDEPGSARSYKEFSRLPGIERDLNLVVDEAVEWAQLEREVRGLALADLVGIAFRDLYRGRQIPSGMKSLTFTLQFRSSTRTLTGDEADQAAQRVVARLSERLGATLRG